MMIHYMHSYCGGRLITGLYNPQGATLTHGYVWEKCAKDWKEASDGSNARGDSVPYLPGTIEEFQQILRKFLYVEHGKEGYQGVVFAVTNHEQYRAPEYLKATGFKEAGRFSKTDYKNDCITWIGDYRKDMYPILSKVRPFKAQVKSESKFSAPPASTVYADTAATTEFRSMPPQVSNTIRDRAQQTLSSSNGGQSAVRTSSRY